MSAHHKLYTSCFLRGLPPPTPRRGRCAFHWSMVSGSQPLVVPMIASRVGNPADAAFLIPRYSLTSLVLRTRNTLANTNDPDGGDHVA